MIIKKNDEKSIEKTVEILKKGGVVIIPTDTVYGFSGIVTQPTDNTIRTIKGREETKPLIRLIADPQDIWKYTNDKIPQNLLDKWPGALTIIVNVKQELEQDLGQKTIAFRCPGDEWLRKIISLTDNPIFSTSVNKSGFPVLDTIKEIVQTFEKDVDLIVDDGDKKGAMPSSLVAIQDGKIKILRQGSVLIN